MLNFKTIQHPAHDQWMIFIHGAGGSIKTWKYQEEAFSAHYNLLMIDLRDHGDSKQLQPEHPAYTFELISEDILKVMDQLEIQQAYFLSLSLGSVIIQDFALRFPNRIHKAIVAGGIFSASLSLKAFVYLALTANKILPYRWMYRIFSYIVMPRRRNQFARSIYQKQAALLTQEEYLKWLGLYTEVFRLLKNFYTQNLAFEMHLIMGGEDYIFLSGARRFTNSQSKVTMAEIDGCGHICNIESHAQFNKLALQYLLSK